MLLFLVLRYRLTDIVFDDVIAQNYADWLARCEIFRQGKRVGYSSFSFLVSIIQVLQSEIAAVPKQAQEITGVLSPRYEENLFDSGVNKGLNWVVHHWLVIDG